MEDDAAPGADPLGDLGDRLDRPDLVVGQHDADQDRAVGQRGLELVRIDPSVPVDGQLDDLEPELLEIAQACGRRRGARSSVDHDPMAARLAGPGRALQGQVVRLRPARGEDDLAGLGAEPGGEPLVGLVERRAGAPAVGMRRARVAEHLGQVRQHRLDDLAVERGRRGVIEVDRHRADCIGRVEARRRARRARPRRQRPVVADRRTASTAHA